MNIRPYTEEDYLFTHDIHQENMITYIDKYWGGWNSDIYKKDIRPENTWIIEHDGKGAGFFVLAFDEKAHLSNIQVQVSFQNMGLGAKVLNSCEAECIKRGFTSLFLEAYLENRARNLYERLGYKTYHITDSHYLMKKDLNI
ncbi:GNAT family N-acetyltransferase [Thermodesulfobacteriota bacterium]